jgi:hypothetical protein
MPWSDLNKIIQLNAQQLQLDKLKEVNDFQMAGLTKLPAFDQYVSAFFSGGRKVRLKQHYLFYNGNTQTRK